MGWRAKAKERGRSLQKADRNAVKAGARIEELKADLAATAEAYRNACMGRDMAEAYIKEVRMARDLAEAQIERLTAHDRSSVCAQCGGTNIVSTACPSCGANT